MFATDLFVFLILAFGGVLTVSGHIKDRVPVPRLDQQTQIQAEGMEIVGMEFGVGEPVAGVDLRVCVSIGLRFLRVLRLFAANAWARLSLTA